jgi:hypothetical protein
VLTDRGGPMKSSVCRRLRTLLPAALLVVVALEAPAMAVPPSNDSISAAVGIGAPPGRFVVDTRRATASSSDGSCVRGRSVWFRSRPSVTRTVRLSTLGSTYDTVLTVFRGTRAHRTRIACVDDSFDTNAASARQIRLVAGRTYWIAVSACCGRSAPGGRLVLSTFRPVAAGLRTTITAVETGAVSGRLLVHGTARCTTPSELDVSLVVSQRVGAGGANVASGEGAFTGICGRRTSRWAATVDSSTGWAFAPGRVSMTSDALASDGFEAVEVGPRTRTYVVTLNSGARTSTAAGPP